jgi:hypothetical protein
VYALIATARLLTASRFVSSFHLATTVAPSAADIVMRQYAFSVVTPAIRGCPASNQPSEPSPELPVPG